MTVVLMFETKSANAGKNDVGRAPLDTALAETLPADS